MGTDICTPLAISYVRVYLVQIERKHQEKNKTDTGTAPVDPASPEHDFAIATWSGLTRKRARYVDVEVCQDKLAPKGFWTSFLSSNLTAGDWFLTTWPGHKSECSAPCSHILNSNPITYCWSLVIYKLTNFTPRERGKFSRQANARADETIRTRNFRSTPRKYPEYKF